MQLKLRKHLIHVAEHYNGLHVVVLDLEVLPFHLNPGQLHAQDLPHAHHLHVVFTLVLLIWCLLSNAVVVVSCIQLILMRLHVQGCFTVKTWKHKHLEEKEQGEGVVEVV